MDNESLNELEEQLVLLLTKPQWNNHDVEAIQELVTSSLDWSRVIGIIQIHRIAGICWLNLFRNEELLNTKCSFGRFYDYLRNIYSMQELKGQEQFRLTMGMCNKFRLEQINFALMKGSALAVGVYRNMGSRDFVDNDILVHPSEINKASRILKELGYIQGKVDVRTGGIIPAAREELLSWSMYSHEVHPFIKKVEHPFLRYHIVDMHYSVDLNTKNRTDNIVENLLKSSITFHEFPDVSCLSKIDMLVFICNHFYKEATSFDEILNYRDLLLYKICDIAFSVYNNDFSWEELVSKAKENKCNEGVYYSLFYTNELYKGLIPEEVLQALAPNDTSYLHKVYQYDSDLQMIEWEDPIVQRVFKMNRAAAFRL
ncbi:nucleotidyltransferase family protein [Paenibacillus glacialis]|uniref:Nucleotidyltransferase family protein n=1 Tax=Paenibacillus glacialis TaxID=494026 RepID=A0A168D0J1_9BACL|nr:nucleotidyltransferase family protein [Paenibacillus glacialis]OAB33772.1 hypothetical protein PGLA_22825 [Paenibacillus glacialis]